MTNLDYGCGCVNDTLIQMANPNLPIGGVGESGMGQYHGKAGFDTFSTVSSVLKATSLDLNPLRYPPFDDTYSVIKTILRYFS